MKIIVRPDISFKEIILNRLDRPALDCVGQSQHIGVSLSFILQNSAEFLQAVGWCAQGTVIAG